jgi:hypothetical protein
VFLEVVELLRLECGERLIYVEAVKQVANCPRSGVAGVAPAFERNDRGRFAQGRVGVASYGVHVSKATQVKL